MNPKTFRIICLLFAALLTVSGCQTAESGVTVSYLYPSTAVSAPAGDLPEYAPQMVSLPYIAPELNAAFGVADFDFRYDALTDPTERSVYAALVSAMLAFARKTVPVPVGETFTDERARELLDAVQTDYPQFFEQPYGCDAVLENGEVYYNLQYGSDSLETLRAGRERFYARVNELLTQAAGYSDAAQRELFLYETVMRSAEYDFAEMRQVGTNRNAHTADGCLTDGRTVCEGYARAFCLLANYSGIRAAVVYGNLPGSVYHAWIAVERGDGFLFGDPTLDDAERRYAGSDRKPYGDPDGKESMTALPDALLHTYYNLTYAEISRDHTFDEPSWEALSLSEAPDAERWQIQNGVCFDGADALSDWLTETLPELKSGDVVEFGMKKSIGRSAVLTLIERQTAGFALTSNGANTDFALYVY